MADTQHVITTFWDDRAADYDAQPGHGVSDAREHNAWVRALTAHMPAAPCDVLDVGTGTGMLAFLFAEMGHRATGVDLAESMLEKARTKAAVLGANAPQFASGDAVAPPFEPATFDVIANRHLFWTLREPQAALANWRRLLRPGGRLLLIDGLWFSGPPAPSDDEDRTPYTAEVRASLPMLSGDASFDLVLQMMETAGFSDVQQTALDEVNRVQVELEITKATDPPLHVMTGVAR